MTRELEVGVASCIGVDGSARRRGGTGRVGDAGPGRRRAYAGRSSSERGGIATAVTTAATRNTPTMIWRRLAGRPRLERLDHQPVAQRPVLELGAA